MKFALKTTTLLLVAALATSTATAANDPIWPFNKLGSKAKAKREQQAQIEAAERQALVERMVADSIERLLAEQAKVEEVEPEAKGHEGAISDSTYWRDHFAAMSVHQRDSVVSQWYEKTAIDAFDNYYKEYICIDTTWAPAAEDVLPDSVYAARLKAMVSPIHLPYNEIVRNYIVRYTSPTSGLMSRVLGLSQYYFPMIEQELINADLPVELRALPIIESALQPTAKSRAAAVGLWQFVYATGKAYGLEINSFVDERCDPLQSTRAACKYLKDLYRTYNDWSLALAAYNCGPGNVNKAIARAGVRGSFWDIYDYLPRETRGYVPAFIAATYAYNYYTLHGINVTTPPMPMATDTIMISRVMHLEQVASTIDIPIETLRLINPQYRLDIIPASTKSYPLTLPVRDLAHYIINEDSIMAKDSLYLKEYLDPAAVEKKRVEENVARTITHVVKRGETLGGIARRYGVTTRQIMQWNNLKNANTLRIGQRLRIQRRR